MSAVASLFADTHFAQGQGCIVKDHNYAVDGNFVKIHGGADRFAGKVHIGAGLHKENAVAAKLAESGIGFEFKAVDFYMRGFRSAVDCHKSRIVACSVIFRAGVAKTGDYKFRRTGNLVFLSYLFKKIPNVCHISSKNQ